MKKIVSFFAVAAIILAASCQKNTPAEPSPKDDDKVELKAPVLSASPASVVLSEKNLSSDALTLSWTSALKTGEQATIIYTVYANLTGRDMYSSPKTFSAGGQLEFAFKGSDLNTLVSNLGTEVGKDVELQFSVYAKSDDDNIESVTSNILKVAISTYKEEVVVPETLYIAGSATDAAWDTSKGIACVKQADGKHKAENVNLNLTISDTGFKFYFANDGSSDCFFGPDRKSDDFGAALLYTEDDGSANLFQPAMHGYKTGKYTIVLDTQALEMTLTRTGDISTDVTFGDNVYALGNCFEWGWSFTNPMTKVSDKVYEIQNVKCQWGDNGDSGFKIFLENGKWSPYFAQSSDATASEIKMTLVTDSEAPQFYPGLLEYANGFYTIRADFNTMVLTLTPGEDPNPSDGFDEDSALFIVGGSFSKYKEWTIQRECALVCPDKDNVYKSENPIYLDKWSYFRIASKDYKQDYSRKVGAANYWTAQVKATGDEEPFIPGNGNADWVDALYDVVFDLNTMTLTCTMAANAVDPSKAFYIFGDGFGESYESWTFNEGLAMMPTSEGVYETVSPVYLLNSAYFKFDKQDWTEYVRDQTASDYWTVTPRVKEPVDNDKGFVAADAGLQTGWYNVKLDTISLKVTLTEVEK